MIFVHGWCSRLEHWSPQADYFAKDYRILRYDRRGHGESSRPADGYNPERHSQDLDELCANTGMPPAVVIAHAGGGPTTLRFAARYPGRVEAVVLVEANLYTADDQRQRTTPLMQAMKTPGYLDVFKPAYSRFFAPGSDAQMVERSVNEAAQTPASVILAELEGLVVDTWQLAREVTQPVLWISAVPRAGETDAAGIGKAFANAAYGQVVGSAHFPQLEVPDQVNAMLRRFLQASEVDRQRRP